MGENSDTKDVKRRIRAEFVRSLKSSSYSKVTVKGLATSLSMSRQNFYHYYTSKEEILQDVVDDILETLYQTIDANMALLDTNPEGVLDLLTPMMLQNRRHIGEMMDRGTDEVVFSHLLRFVRRFIGRLLREKDINLVQHDLLDVLVRKLAGSWFQGIKAWSQLESDLSAEQLKSLYRPDLQQIMDSLETLASN